MSLYSESPKQVRKAIRAEMLAQSEILLRGMYPDTMQRKAAARTMVDRALAAERRRHVDPTEDSGDAAADA